MRHLPMFPVDEVATKGDVALVRDDLETFKEDVREFKAEMREFKAEMREFRTEINARFDKLQRQQYTISMATVTVLTATFALISRLSSESAVAIPSPT